MSGRPAYLYVFGKLGGPFKVGYSVNPRMRASAIVSKYPGDYFADESAIMWERIAFANEDAAKDAERAAHKALVRHRIHAPDRNGSVAPTKRRTEWFDVSLEVAQRAVAKAIHGNGNVIPFQEPKKASLLQVLLTEELSQRLDDIRRSEPDIPTRSDMLRRLIERAPERK